MKIILISTACLPVPPAHYGGLEMIVYDLAVCLSEEGHEVKVAAPIGSKLPEPIEIIHTVNVNKNKWDENVALLNYINHVHDTDIIHDHSHQKLIYQFLEEHEADNRYCSTLHCPTSVLYQVVDPCLITISHDHAQRIRNRYGYWSRVVHNGIDLSRFTYSEEKGDRYIFLGRPNVDKGNLTAIRYCKELDLPLDMVGGALEDGPTDYSIEVARLCRLGSEWKYHGSVTHDRKAELLSNAKALIFPCADTWNEPFGLIIPEANASGTPVVAWNRGVFKETVVHGETGFLANNEEEFKEYMGMVDQINPKDCKKWVEDNFTREIMTENYINVYKDILDGKKW